VSGHGVGAVAVGAVRKTQTLIYDVEAMTANICRMLDASAPPAEVEAARAARDRVKAEIHGRPDGRNYDKGYT
jgi:hypothetical protein